MADFVNFGRSLVEHVTKSFSAAKGAKIKYSMSGKELDSFINNPDNPELFGVWLKLGLDKKKGVTLDIATKAKSNYNIASIKLITDTSSLVSGCYSTSKEATGEVAKYHFSDKKKVYQGYETSETELDRVTPNTTIPLTPEKYIIFEKI